MQYDEPIISLEHPADGVGLLRFADPARQNQLCWKAVDTLAQLLDDCVAQGVRVVVLASDLPGHWLEHAWLGDLIAGLEGREATSDGAGWHHCIDRLSRGPLISIAAVSGDTCGGGCEIGWACDLRIAERQARFSQPEVRLGITPGLGGISRVNALLGRTLAGEMVLKGEWISAERIHTAGGINRLVEAGEALPAALAWAQDIAQMPVQALKQCKQVLAGAQELPLEKSLQKEQETIQATAASAHELMKKQQSYYDEGGTTAAAFAPAD